MQVNINKKNCIESFIEQHYKLCYIIVFLFLGILCFYKLGESPILKWDEARHGVNAYEMIKNNDFIVHTYDYKTDYWNLKPSISYWCIALSYRIFGYSNFSLRIYSALALMLTLLISCNFIKKRYGKLESIMFLVISISFSNMFFVHWGRSGDADGLYILFYTIAMLAMILIPENKDYIYVSGLCFALAFLTKSWHAMSIAVIGGLYLLFTGEIKKLGLKRWLIFIIVSFLPIIIWFAIRYCYDGMNFLNEMIEYDLLSRSSSALEEHVGSKMFYIKNLISDDKFLLPTFLCIFIYLISELVSNKGKIKVKESFVKFINSDWFVFALWILIPLVIFTAASTKLSWYTYSIYIPIFIGCAILLSKIIKITPKIDLKFAAIILCLLSLVVKGFWNIHKIESTLQASAIQSFIQNSSSRDSQYAGLDLYIQDSNESEWEQDNLLKAELVGDYVCKDGGVEEFLDSQKSLLLIDNETYADDENIIGQNNIIYDSDDYKLISKN